MTNAFVVGSSPAAAWAPIPAQFRAADRSLPEPWESIFGPLRRGVIDDLVLAENDAADAFAHPRNVRERLFGLGDHFLFADLGLLDDDAHAAWVLIWLERRPAFSSAAIRA